MLTRIPAAKAKLYMRSLRKHTRGFRFLSHLILLQLRLWLSPVWPFRQALYPDYPEDPWQGDADKGRALMRGEFCSDMGGSFYDNFWKCVLDLPQNTQRRLHEFQWLRHLATHPNRSETAVFARKLMDEWSEHQNIHPDISHQVITRAERLSYCFCYHGLLAEGASEKWLQQQRRYYYEEVLALADIMRRKEGDTSLSVLKALLFAAILIPSMNFLQRPVMRSIEKVMPLRFFDDGGHRTRSPELQRWDMATLLEIRAAMKKRQIPISPEFDDLMQRGLDALASFMHGDDKLACFHGSIEQPVDMFINLWQVWRKPKPLPQKTLPSTGYVHLRRNDSTLIFDVGYKPMLSRQHYVGPLAFEFSRSGARFIVNCGAYRGTNETWKQVSHRTAAHSTLSLDQFDAWGTGKVEDSFKVGHCSVEESEQGIAVVADHYGYVDRFGYAHERKVKLSEDGKTVLGVDSVRPVPKRFAFSGEAAEKLYVRFHLHPSVSVEKMAPQAVTLKLKNGELWDFSVNDPDLVPLVEESIYLGQDGVPKPTMQLVIVSPLKEEEEQRFPWKFEWNKG